jgi:hypothetical protein
VVLVPLRIEWNQHAASGLVQQTTNYPRTHEEFIMARLAALSAALLFTLASPASAQHVIYNPGWCAQFYPNANCQNYGPGNPYTNYGWRYAYGRAGHYPRRIYHRHRRY